MSFFYKNKKGFTLIELLVVVAIISLLSSIVMASLNNARSKARDVKRKSDLKQIQIALELYYDKYGSYPAGVYSTTGYANDMATLAIVPEFLSKMSIDPINTNTFYGYYYARDYVTTGSACSGATSSDYILATRLENSTKSAIMCWNNSNINYVLGNTSEYR
jgi:prepilin-type N-terminal cleavage/methylation domain-containing protein